MLGLGSAVLLLAVKENALFLYASALTFALVWIANRWLTARFATSAVGGKDAAPRVARGRAGAAARWLGGLLVGLSAVAAIYGLALGPAHHQEAISAVVGGDTPTVTAVTTKRHFSSMGSVFQAE